MRTRPGERKRRQVFPILGKGTSNGTLLLSGLKGEGGNILLSWKGKKAESLFRYSIGERLSLP